MGEPKMDRAVAAPQGFTDEDLALMFEAQESNYRGESVFDFKDRTFINADAMSNLKKGLDDFFKSLEPVLAPTMTKEDVAKAISRRFSGRVTGQNGMLKHFTEFDGQNAKLNPDEAKRVAQEFGLEVKE